MDNPGINTVQVYYICQACFYICVDETCQKGAAVSSEKIGENFKRSQDEAIAAIAL
jgi:hypothetical protein